MQANIDVIDWSIPDEQFKELSSLEPQVRMVSGSGFLKPQGPYKTVEELWDE